jgi:Lon protease-like protein
MNLDFNPIEKQALLEADDLNQRWDNLIALMQMASLEEVSNPSGFIN